EAIDVARSLIVRSIEQPANRVTGYSVSAVTGNGGPGDFAHRASPRIDGERDYPAAEIAGSDFRKSRRELRRRARSHHQRDRPTARPDAAQQREPAARRIDAEHSHLVPRVVGHQQIGAERIYRQTVRRSGIGEWRTSDWSQRARVLVQ